MNPADTACLVLSSDSPAGALAIVRALGRRAIPTYVAVVDGRCDVVGSSRWCAGATRLEAGPDPTDLVDRSIAWMRRYEPRRTIAMIATSDLLALALARAPDRTGDGALRIGPTAAVAETLTSKPLMFAAARSAGLAVPDWVLVDDDIAPAALAHLTYPLIIRPASQLDPFVPALKLAVARHPAETADLIATHRPRIGPLIVQSYLGGADASYEFGLGWRSARTGRTDVCTGRKVLQSTPDGGFMIAGRTTPIADVDDHTRRLMDHVGFTGIGGAEFVRRGGELWFVEFNPRPEAIQFLGIAAGHDHPWVALLDAIGDDPPPLGRPATVSGWVGTATIEPLRHIPRHRWPVLREWLRHLGTRRRARQMWSWRDPRPGLQVITGLIAGALRR